MNGEFSGGTFINVTGEVFGVVFNVFFFSVFGFESLVCRGFSFWIFF